MGVSAFLFRDPTFELKEDKSKPIREHGLEPLWNKLLSELEKELQASNDTLTPEEQLIAGNAWMRLLINRAGSLKDAVPYLEGRKKLAEIGLERELDDVLEMVGKSSSLLIDANPLYTQQLISVN